jgi:hypothetical protein
MPTKALVPVKIDFFRWRSRNDECSAIRVSLSIASFWLLADDFRSTSDNGHHRSQSACLKRANDEIAAR